ncbi:type II asparaginase [Thauera sinica]|uniref:Type II asparaginase n=1 Tax=Thauera sinica TaxID=2665146 RepID=A0ABW1AMB3_9RHOO|nr:type II asparaginase [Thauera sp. K11]ATE59241.1 L-asparaginase [Thauera sp. K11]
MHPDSLPPAGGAFPSPLPAALPRIALLGTGGTIAASARDAVQLHDYRVTEGVDAILAAVPQVRELAEVHCEQLMNVESHEIDDAGLLAIARRVQALLDDDGIDGVVLTHGTDTLEETAYFLNLVLDSAKPVVIVGAMRPASALSADGPLNLLNAFRLATCAEAAGKGVLVMLNDRIGAARHVTKMHTTATDAFFSVEQGSLGEIAGGVVHFFNAPTRRHTVHSEFSLADIGELPQVDIIFDHLGAGTHLYRAAIAAGARGIVLAATGNGSLSPSARQGAEEAKRHGVAFVRASRVGQGVVTDSADDAVLGTIAANSLNPQKARLLLMLALCVTRDTDAIRECFRRY